MAEESKPFQGFRCKTCGTIIPLQDVFDTAPQRLVWQGSIIASFTFTCKKCGKTHTYSGTEIESFNP
jgi:hypothetical protein